MAMATWWLGCSDVQPCSGSGCPNIAGHYLLVYEAPVASGACVARGPTSNDLTVVQDGSQLTGEVAGVATHGTLLDTFDFSLSASSSTADGGYDVLGVLARYIPSTQTDAGARVRGRLLMTYQRGASSCDVATPFTGAHD